MREVAMGITDPMCISSASRRNVSGRYLVGQEKLFHVNHRERLYHGGMGVTEIEELLAKVARDAGAGDWIRNGEEELAWWKICWNVRVWAVFVCGRGLKDRDCQKMWYKLGNESVI